MMNGSAATSDVTITLLGEPAVEVCGELRRVTRPREQALLARLALSAPHAVAVETLVDDIWGSDPPDTVVDAVRVHVSNLRKVLAGAGRPASHVLVTTPGGYRMEVGPDDVDVQRLDAACRTADVAVIRSLSGSWPDQDLGRFDTGTGFFTAAAVRIEDLRATAAEHLAESELGAGRHAAAAESLEEVLRHRRFRERSWQLLVRSLHGAGRRTDALRAVQRARSALADVGIEPGADLAAVEQAVLGHDVGRGSLERSQLTSGYVDVDGSRIAYATLGQHPTTLLFLHGGFVPFDVMGDEPRLARFLQALAERFRVVLIDRRGIGMSDPPASGSSVTLDHWVADCRAVLDAEGARDVLVLAHENAGPVALRLAADHPARVRGLVLHATVARYLRAADHPFGPTEEVYAWIGRMIDRRLGEDELLRSVAPSVGDDRELAAWLDRAGRLGAGPARARQLHRLYVGTDVRHLLPRVQAPTIVLQPTRRIHSDPGQGRYLAEHLPHAELQLLDSGDHLPWLADAGAVLAAVARIAERTSSVERCAPLLLRAILAVAPARCGDMLDELGAERCIPFDGSVVATFSSRSGAEAAAAVVQRRYPDARTAITLDDTRATPTDPAVTAARDRLGPPHP